MYVHVYCFGIRRATAQAAVGTQKLCFGCIATDHKRNERRRNAMGDTPKEGNTNGEDGAL